MIKIKILSFAFVAFLLAQAVVGVPVLAQPPNQLSVTPAFINVELSDVNTVEKTQIAITNTYASNIDLLAELKGIDEVSGKLVPSGDIDPTLEQAVKLSSTDFTAAAKGMTILEVNVTNTPELAPGGHYASLVLSQKPKAGQQAAYTSQISISIFIIKLGGERRNVEAKVLNSNQNIFKLPSSIKLAFSNTGNTHVTPRASVIVTTSSGQTVANGVANTGSQPLLPGKELNSTISLTQTRFLWLPQKLKQVLSFRVDGSESIKQSQLYFWYVPPIFILLLFAIPTLLFFVYRYARLLIKNRKKLFSRVKKVKKEPKVAPIANDVIAMAIASEFQPSESEIKEVHVILKKNKKTTKKPSKKASAKTKKKAPKKPTSGGKKTSKT